MVKMINASLPSADQKKHTVIVGDVSTVLSGSFYGPVNLQAAPSSVESFYRQTLLSSVRAVWLTKYLPSSFDNSIHIPLTFTAREDAIDSLPATETSIEPRVIQPIPYLSESQLFHSYGQRLLVIGAAGSGKTIFLVRLLKELVEAAERDAHKAIPVILNLGSWTARRLVFKNWIIDRLCKGYQISRACAQALIHSQALIFLFDGLDEVPAADRESCITALNTFMQSDDAPIVVCCRDSAYQALKIQLRLRSAFAIEQLDDASVNHFLEWAGARVQGIREAIEGDQELHTLIATPLMLLVLVQAYTGQTVEHIHSSGSLSQRNQQIFAAYVETMLARYRLPLFRNAQLQIWLRSFARLLAENHTTEFFIEDMQPDWLQGKRERQWYWMLVIIAGFGLAMLLFGILGYCAAGLTAIAIHILDDRVLDRMILHEWAFEGAQYGALGGIVGVCVALARRRTIRIPQLLRLSRASIIRAVLPALIIGIIGTFFSGLMLWYWSPDQIPWLASSVAGIVIGATALIIIGLTSGEILRARSADQVVWHGLIFALGAWFLAFTASGIAIVAMVVVQSFIYDRVWLDDLWFVLSLALRLATFTGAVAMLISGGWSIWQHGILRLMLARRKIIPFRLELFLSYLADALLLRSVGTGYRFMHALLQEYLVGSSQNMRDT